MAILSNINGKFAVESTGAIQFNGSNGTAGYILKSNGNASPTWVAASTVIGGPYLPLTGGILTGATSTASGISFTVGGVLTTQGDAYLENNVYVGNTSNEFLETRYNSTSDYAARYTWKGLQFGNNGINRIVAGRTAVGGYLNFYVNNTNDGLANTPDGTLALTLAADATATFGGDVQAPGIYVGATNTSFDFYNNGTTYLNGATTIDDTLTMSNGFYIQSANGNGKILLSGHLHIDSHNSNQIFLNYYSGQSVRVFAASQVESFRVDANQAVYAYNQLQTPIMYDYNNTGYYIDGHQTSNLNYLNVGIGVTGRSSSASYSMTAGNWYRIAYGSGRCCGVITLQDGISSGGHGNITFYAGASYNTYQLAALKLLGQSWYNLASITNTRVLTKGTYDDQYIEVYCSRTGTYQITIERTHYYTNAFSLYTSATSGSVPSGYSEQQMDVNGMLIAEAGNGSNRFAVDRAGAIHLAGGVAGTSGQVLTSGGAGAPTWTTLANQGGPYLPLTGGTMSGQINATTIDYNGIVSGTQNGVSMMGRNHAYDTVELKGYGAEFMMGAQNTTLHINYRTCNNGASGHTPTDWYWRAGSSSSWSNHHFGYLYGEVDTRSPIFYDNNNTAYYVNPDGTSNLNAGIFAGTVAVNAQNSISLKGQIDLPSGSTSSAGSTPAYSIYQTAGAWTYPYPDLNLAMHTGIRLGANPSYGGIRFYNDYNMVTQVMSVNNASDGVGSGHVYVNNVLQAGSSLRAPIFYDSNDTTYYLDPHGTSVQRNIHIKQGSTLNLYRSGDGAWVYHDSRAEGSYAALYKGTNNGSAYGDYREYWYSGTTGSYQSINQASNRFNFSAPITAATDIRAPIFYDSSNTTYYTRPATSSNINSLYTAGLIQAGASGGGDVYIGGTSGNYFRFHLNNSDSYFDMNCGNIYWRQGASTRFYFYATTANMTINGSLTQNSDVRVKENIVEISDCIDKVKAIRGVYYNRTDFNTEVTKVGVIAQEVEKVLPEVILEAPDTGLKSVAYAELTPVLVNALKEQQVIIDDLKSRIEILENN